MPENAKVILCAPVPTWIYGELKAKDSNERAKFYRGLDYIALEIIKMNCKNAHVFAALSGDTHHYSRYSAAEDGTQFITSGGGGAFLHPTHQLPDQIGVTWMGEDRTLSLFTDPGDGHKPSANAACYPSREESLNLLKGNQKFPFTNWSFSLTLGLVYWAAEQILWVPQGDILSRPLSGILDSACQIFSAVIVTPVFWIVAVAFCFGLFLYADAKSKIAKATIGVAHAIPHLFTILALTSFGSPINSRLLGLFPGSFWSFAANLSEAVVIGGFAAAFIWGRYLTSACKRLLHTNDGFSAMKLGKYRHFLRIRITADSLTIYSIGLDEPPSRCQWQYNLNGGRNQNEAIVVPNYELQPHLIEDAIVVRV